MSFWEEIKFDKNGLIPAIIQDHRTGKVLMLGYMNKQTLKETIEGDRPVFWSRSRKDRWIKGETSGNIQKIKEILFDCDGDALVIKVEQKGPVCHTKHLSCFYRKLTKDSKIEIIEPKIE